MSHKIPENHTNVQTFYKSVDIWSLKAIKALDHKMNNIDTGIMSNASSYPCANCKVDHLKLETCGVERTVPSLAYDCERFIAETGGNGKLGN